MNRCWQICVILGAMVLAGCSSTVADGTVVTVLYSSETRGKSKVAAANTTAAASLSELQKSVKRGQQTIAQFIAMQATS